ncbi:MAG: integrase [Bryobacterales bacterium]|nr:integrase [Bryobacterales bacterium]
MDIPGHSQIGLTMNTYGYVVTAVQHEAASKMDAILGGAAVTDQNTAVQ